MHVNVHTLVHTHNCTCTHSHTCSHTHKHAQKQILKRTLTNSPVHTCSHTHNHTQKINACTHFHKYTSARTQTVKHVLTQPLTCLQTHKNAHMHRAMRQGLHTKITKLLSQKQRKQPHRHQKSYCCSEQKRHKNVESMPQVRFEPQRAKNQTGPRREARLSLSVQSVLLTAPQSCTRILSLILY